MAKKENKTVILIDLKSYPLEAVYAAAYSFLDKTYIFLETQPKSKIRISLKGKKRLTRKESEALKGEFLNELLNSALRNKISKNNKKIREHIVVGAIASAIKEVSFGSLTHKGGESSALLQDKDISETMIPWDKIGSGGKQKKQLLGRQKKEVWEKDRLGIAIPWEERYPIKKQGKKKKKK